MFLDTHAAVFLHAGRKDLFSPLALHLLDTEEVLLSPMAALEIQYLFEVGKITFDAATILADLSAGLDVKVVDRHWMSTVRLSLDLPWTRDPFDRLITAQAMVEGQRLLTRNRVIQEHCSLAFW